MNSEVTLLSKIETGIARLQGLSPDGAAYRNEVGFSGQHVQIGAALAQKIGEWSPRMALIAWRVCGHYRNTQLADLEIPLPPKFDDVPEAAEVKQQAVDRCNAARSARIEQVKATQDYGLRFGGWKAVNTKAGLREVRSAAPTEDFWSLWRNAKDDLKAEGFSVGQFNGAWTVSQWRVPAVQQIVQETDLGIEEPVSNPFGLLAYQIPSAERLANSLRRNRAAVDASDTGTGKTYVALAAFRELGLSPVVVCPKSVVSSWKRAASHLGVEVRAINYEMVRRGTTPFGSWAGEGRDKRFVWAADVTALVFDEAHRCKGADTQNALLVRAAADQRIPTVLASATLAHSPLEMRAAGRLLGLHNWRNFWQWSRGYGCHEGRWGGFEFDGEAIHLERLGREIFPAKGTRVRIPDLGDAFPESQIATELVDLNGDAAKVNKVYAEMEKELAEVARREASDGRSAAALTAMLRARQKAELLKVPAFVEHIEDAVEEGMSVFVAVCFRDSLAAIVEKVRAAGIEVREIHGDQTADERDAAIADFQADSARVIVAMVQAGGVGISLHDLHGRHPRLALLSPTWSAVELRQALGRVHRAGGRTKSVQRVLFAAGTVEERVAAKVQAKLDRLDSLNDAELELAERTEARAA